MRHEIRYGKADVKVYRTYAEPLIGITPFPSRRSPGRDNALTAAAIEVRVHGTEFLDAYTKGDNRKVVATDTMKNFIHASRCRGGARCLEEWLARGRHRLPREYPHMERLAMLGRDSRSVRERAGQRRDGCTASRSPVQPRPRRCRRGPLEPRPHCGRRRDGHRPASRRAGPPAHQDHRHRRSRTSRATSTPRCPSDATGPSTSTRRSAGATRMPPIAVLADPARYVPCRPGRRPGRDRLPRVRQPLDPASRQRDRAAHARALAAAGRGQLRRSEPALGRRRRGG